MEVPKVSSTHKKRNITVSRSEIEDFVLEVIFAMNFGVPKFYGILKIE